MNNREALNCPPPRHNRIVERDYGFFNIIRYYGIRTVRSIQLLPASGASVLISLYSRSELARLFNYSHHKRSAFTLAEVLITLGIIGIVAALTMPSLIANYQEKVLVAAAKRSYSTLENALHKWLTDNDIPGEYEHFWLSIDTDEERLETLAKELNIANICLKSSDVGKCGGKYDVKLVKRKNDGFGNVKTDATLNDRRIVLSDGSFISLYTEVQNGSCTHTYWTFATDKDGNYIPTNDPESPNGYEGQYNTNSNCGFFYIDTNGLKGPNQFGKDVFKIGSTAKKLGLNSNDYGNLGYVLTHDKLIETEKYSLGKF